MSVAAFDEYFDLDDIVGEILAADYLRVSRDKSGVLRSPAEQHDENGELCVRKRWTLRRSYVDEGSASIYQRRRRPDFDQLIADLRADEFNAHVLIIWEVSRGTRRAGEMETLLGLCQQRGVWIYVYNKRRLFNPHVVDDWEDLMHAAVDAAGESMRTSQRTKRASKADAKAGSFTGGRRPYGYEANGIDINPEESRIIEECVEAVLAGKTVREIAAGLNRRGIPTSGGNTWNPGPLAKLLASPRIAGKRVHNGVVVGDAAWAGIVDEVTHKRIVATLKSRSPVGRRGRTPWVLTGFLRCGRILPSGKPCEAPLVGNTDTGGTRRYICRKAPGYSGCGGLGIKAADLEAILGDLATERLHDVDARRSASVAADDSGDRAELDAIALRRIEVAEDYAAGGSREQKREDSAALDRRQKIVEQAIAAKTRESAPLDFVLAEGFLGRRWVDLEVAEQRVILSALIERVTVAPATVKGSTRFEAARVLDGDRIAWRV